MVDTVEQAIYRLRAEGQEQVDRLKASVDGLVVSEEKLDGTTRTSSQALQNRLARMDPLIRAQQQYQKELESAQRYMQSGVGTQAQQNAQITLATQRYNAQVTAIKAVEKATGAHVAATSLARYELINLGRQGADVFTQLASGQALWLIGAQQGPQILDVLATSQKGVVGTLKEGVSWLGRFAMSTPGIVTGIGAIAAGAIYMASQFARASTTIEQALEEQNRLLKEGKALLDQRTSLEARAQLQSKEQTQFETLRNQLDLQVKLNAAMEEAARLAASKAGRPTGGGMPEMGIAPTGVGALSAPGYEKIIEAHEKLKAAQAAGLPGIKEFNAELAKVGLAHPELALIVQDMIKVGEEGLKLEFASQRAKAMADALAGIATNAQMAAVGLGSVAQFQVNNQQAKEAAAATERQAEAALWLAQIYPGVTIETAKQLEQLNGQLGAAQAVTGAAQIEAQHRATINNLLTQGKSLVDAIAIADAQRAVSLAQVNAEADRTLKNLQEQAQLIAEDISDAEKGRIKAAQEYNRLIERGVDAQKAGAIAAQMQANARSESDAREMAKAEQDAARAAEQRARADERAADAAARASDELDRIIAQNREIARISAFIPSGIPISELYKRKDGTLSQFNPEGYKITTQTPGARVADAFYGPGNYTLDNFGNAIPNDQWKRANNPWGGMSAPTTTSTDPQAIALRNQIAALQGMGDSYPNQVAIQQLTAMADAIDQQTQAIKDNTNATNANTDVLSPFYASDPRRTNLGFRAFGGGGIMTPYGELPIKKYDGGGIATTPQVAIFGPHEPNRVPEAYVPVPSGRIPVEMRMPANSNERASQRPIIVNVSMTANVDRDEARKTGFQIAQEMQRRGLG